MKTALLHPLRGLACSRTRQRSDATGRTLARSATCLIALLMAVPAGIAADRPAWDNLPPVQPSANDWPWWRGPNQDNIAPPQQSPPVRWSATENVIWKADVPGRGHGSP
ncbi:MAG: hypothetical protein FJ388_26320, partial [Verrucomicrobia bacterium]|nr:hypothetical protein [Verrucomicrobiota bacterium]